MFDTDYSLIGIFLRFKYKVGGTLSLVLAENFTLIAQPYLIGKAIDGLILKNYEYISLYVGLMASYVLIGTARRMYDTRAYASIRSILSIETVSHQRKVNTSLSATSERTTLCDEIIGFFENGISIITRSIVQIFGALIMLAYIDIRICIFICIIMIIIYGIWFYTRPKVKALITYRNNQRERKVSVIESNENDQIKNHFITMKEIKIKLSNIEALSFGSFQILGIALFIYAIFITTDIEGVSTGLIYSTLTYITSLTNSLVGLPGVFHSIVKVNEISKRLQRPYFI